jgi:hypothetical protein
MLEERRRLARVQNMTAAVAALAMAGTVYGATVTTTASGALVAGLTGVSLVGSVWAMNRSMDARTESEEISEAFVARMAPAFERQMSVQVEWLESREVITARGFAEFRNKTLTLYQSRVRSMAFSADRECAFRGTEIDTLGRWYGQCRDGEADGRGYGVAMRADGASVEYVGHAEQGRASGAGAMILRQPGQSGATYLDGRFSKGLPDGVVRVEKPGSVPGLREYREGLDVGRGDPGRWKQASFAAISRELAGS